MKHKTGNRISLYVFILAFVVTLFLLGRGIPANVPDIEVLFSPQDNCAARVLSILEGAQETIDIAMYYFTDRTLAQALVEAEERGVRIRVYLDDSQKVGDYPKGRYLEGKRIEVKYEDGVGLMHDKFCIVDGSLVISGSFNWTPTADLRNDENLLIIHSAELARKFTEQFEKFWEGNYVDECKYTDETRLRKVEIRKQVNVR